MLRARRDSFPSQPFHHPVTSLLASILSCATGLFVLSASAQALRPDHPIIGTWKFEVPAAPCQEVYRFRSNGTTVVTSAQEVSESKFVISDQPSARGFFQLIDTVVKSNGQKDCGGQNSAVGDKISAYVIFDPSGARFQLCEQEDVNACFGPYVRVSEKKE